MQEESEDRPLSPEERDTKNKIENAIKVLEQAQEMTHNEGACNVLLSAAEKIIDAAKAEE